ARLAFLWLWGRASLFLCLERPTFTRCFARCSDRPTLQYAAKRLHTNAGSALFAFPRSQSCAMRLKGCTESRALKVDCLKTRNHKPWTLKLSTEKSRTRFIFMVIMKCAATSELLVLTLPPSSGLKRSFCDCD